MKKELLTDALGTLDADIIGDYLATEKVFPEVFLCQIRMLLLRLQL